MSSKQPRAGASPLPPELRARAEAVMVREGPAGAAAKLNISVGALTRGLAGAPVRRGTVALLRLALER